MGGVDALLHPGRRAGVAGQRVRIEQAHHERTDGQAGLLHLLLVARADLGVGDGQTLGGSAHPDLDALQSGLARLVQAHHASADADLGLGAGGLNILALEPSQQHGSGQRCRSVLE